MFKPSFAAIRMIPVKTSQEMQWAFPMGIPWCCPLRCLSVEGIELQGDFGVKAAETWESDAQEED